MKIATFIEQLKAAYNKMPNAEVVVASPEDGITEFDIESILTFEDANVIWIAINSEELDADYEDDGPATNVTVCDTKDSCNVVYEEEYDAAIAQPA